MTNYQFLDRIICGDCIDILKKIPNNAIDLTITSPPYDSRRDYKGYIFDYKPLAHELYRVTKNGGIVVWVVADETKDFCESLTSFKQAIFFVEEVGFNLLDTMIYEKKNLPPTYPNIRRYPQSSEYMFIFTKGRPKTFNPIIDRPNKYAGIKKSGDTQRQRDGTTKRVRSYVPKEFGMRFNVWKYHVGKNKDTKDKDAFIHPARFPEKLAEDHILTWSNEGDVILDPLCGSGTTCKMAMLNNRHYVGVEISNDYIKIANDRIKKSRKLSNNTPNTLEKWI